MRFYGTVVWLFFSASVVPAGLALSEERANSDHEIYRYLEGQSRDINAGFKIGSLSKWESSRAQYQREYLRMLGLWPLPSKTPLEPTVTGQLTGDGYVVDLLHYQSRPGLYVTANLYRPANISPGQRLPAVLYVCGHRSVGRNGNKTAYQSHGIWFARHGYICLVLDTLQLGEISAVHHGTYREQRWWWHSRGYTPAGVECWNGIRGIDYLVNRPDVDPDRIAVTGISGGGAATFWITAADERVKVAVPVSGMADLPCYITDRLINRHCDCMFLYNSYRWPWVRIAALVAPRPMLFINSNQDPIFPMDANERLINRLERVYALYGAGDLVDSQVSIGGHAYRQDIRQASYRFINRYLKGDSSRVKDSEVDLVTGTRDAPVHPINPRHLRVFSRDEDIPFDELNTTIDKHFVPMAYVDLPGIGQFARWKEKLLADLRQSVFLNLPQWFPPARVVGEESDGMLSLETEPGIQILLHPGIKADGAKDRIVLVINSGGEDNAEWLEPILKEADRLFYCDVRGWGGNKWSVQNPPNYVRRAHLLLGTTVDEGRVRDVVSLVGYLRRRFGEGQEIKVVGRGPGGVLAAYAALWEPSISRVVLFDPPEGHMDPSAPQFLGILRVCDLSEILGMLAPRFLEIRDSGGNRWERVRNIYDAAGVGQRLKIVGQAK